MTQLNSIFFSKRKVFQLSATFLLTLFILSSCQKDENDIGIDLQGTDQAGTVITDTFTINTYVDFDDSLRSTQTTRNLLGSYNDPELGFVKTGFYTQFRLSASDPNLGNQSTITVDSLVLSLEYAGFYGNTSAQTIQVYRLTEDMDIDQDYYRFSSLMNDGVNYESTGSAYYPKYYEPVVVGTDTLSAHLRIKLDNALGQELVNAAFSGNMVDNETFTNYFKGFYLTVDNGNQSAGDGGIMYFNLLSQISKMTLYYTDNGTQKNFDFIMNENTARFNVYENDYSGTYAEQVVNDKEKGNERFYIQSGALRGGIDFPHLKSLVDAEGDIVVVKAELVLPAQITEGSPFYIPQELFLLELKDDGLQTFLLDNYDPNHIGGLFDESSKSYRFIITRYIQNILNGNSENSSLRLLSPKHFASVERVVFNGQQSNLKDQPKLIVTYTKY